MSDHSQPEMHPSSPCSDAQSAHSAQVDPGTTSSHADEKYHVEVRRSVAKGVRRPSGVTMLGALAEGVTP